MLINEEYENSKKFEDEIFKNYNFFNYFSDNNLNNFHNLNFEDEYENKKKTQETIEFINKTKVIFLEKESIITEFSTLFKLIYYSYELYAQHSCFIWTIACLKFILYQKNILTKMKIFDDVLKNYEYFEPIKQELKVSFEKLNSFIEENHNECSSLNISRRHSSCSPIKFNFNSGKKDKINNSNMSINNDRKRKSTIDSNNYFATLNNTLKKNLFNNSIVENEEDSSMDEYIESEKKEEFNIGERFFTGSDT
jgi:hypothetical protein